MRKIRIFAHVSLDGVIQPDGDDDYAKGGWMGKYRGPAGAQALADEQGKRFDLLLGRRTYDMWSGHWPNVKGGPFAAALNAATKYVTTHRAGGLEWGPVEAVLPDIADGVRRLRSTDGPDLVVWGSTTLTPVLFEHGLVDDVGLVVYPVLLGRGIRFFSDRVDPRDLALVNTKTTATGVLINTYRYVGSARAAPSAG